MKIFKYALGALLLSPVPAIAATATINLDATANTALNAEGAAAIAAGELLPLTVGDGDVTISAISDTYVAYRYGSNPIDCSSGPSSCVDGYTINYTVFDSTGTAVTGFGGIGDYGTAAEALLAAQAAGPKMLFLSAGTYFFAVQDGRNSRGDNEGGISLSVRFTAPSQIPVPASGLLLIAGLGALAVRKRLA